MDTTTRAGSPLRQRMIEDMRMRKLEPRTQEAYIRGVRKLAAYLMRSPDTATVEDLRNFQLHLVDTGSSPMTLNATLTGLKFFFDITLGRIELMAKMQPAHALPAALSAHSMKVLDSVHANGIKLVEMDATALRTLRADYDAQHQHMVEAAAVSERKVGTRSTMPASVPASRAAWRAPFSPMTRACSDRSMRSPNSTVQALSPSGSRVGRWLTILSPPCAAATR